MAGLKREAVLFDFFNGTEADGTPRRADFRYYKTDGTASEKLNCTRSFEDVPTITKSKDITPNKQLKSGTRRVVQLKQNHLIRIRYSDASAQIQYRNLKIKLLTHYRPAGSSEWHEIIHPQR